MKLTGILSTLIVAFIVSGNAAGEGVYDGYMNHAALMKAISDLDAGSDQCTIEVIAKSGQGREIKAITLASDSNSANKKPAIVIVAGIDGRHLIGSETALRVAQDLLADHRDVLEKVTFYIIPRVNPDAAERNVGKVNEGFVGTLTDVDADRDRAMNENGPSDLNGDGVITQMRRANPPLDESPVWMADPVEPRLLKKPDAAKGEVAIYSLYVEGVDEDGDGAIGEDGAGMVDLDKNFMHEWPEYDVDSGVIPLSEPEAKALAKFVLEHNNIVAAITYGRHDNLINKPDSKGRDVSGRGPKEIDAGDESIYEEIGKIYKEVTEQKRGAKEATAGSFVAWLYAQRGVPSFAAAVWGRPDATKVEDEKAEGEKSEGEAKDSGGDGDAKEKDTKSAKPQAAGADDPIGGVWQGTVTVPEMGEMQVTINLERGEGEAVTGSLVTPPGTAALNGTYSPGSGALSLKAMFGPDEYPMELTVQGEEMSGTATGPDGNAIPISAKRISKPEAKSESEGAGGRQRNGKKDDKPKVADEEAAAWLEYSDRDRGGMGFIEWTEFDHPALGKVEIGGFVPGFQMNPPADQLDELAKKQTEFVVKLTEKLPTIRVEGPEVKQLAPGMYDIRLGIVNDGYLPTSTAMARKARSIMPMVVRISTPVENVVSGERVSREWGLDGNGMRSVHHWIVRAADGTEITINLHDERFGNREVKVKMEPGAN